MIITRTPLRISFAGGGSDLLAFCEHETGAVFSATITAYMHIAVTHKFTGDVRLGYSKTENVGWVKDLEHDIARETLAYCGIERAVEVVSVADVPAGTGLGSSSSYAVALLQALYAFRGNDPSAALLAQNACEIEINRCGHPIGKQDQYAAAFGGMRLYEFAGNNVEIHSPIQNGELEKRLMLIYTGASRDASGVLAQQKTDRSVTREMALLARVLSGLAINWDADEFGEAMDEAWQLKRRQALVDDEVDGLLALAKKNGARAGKLCGAGGTGFLLLLVPPECRDRVSAVMNVRPRRELRFKLEPEGSRVIYAQ